MKRANILIMVVTLMDLITAFLILFDPTPLRVARLGIFYEVFPTPIIGGLLMLLAALCAIVGLTLPSHKLNRFLLFIPQQIFLILTTGSAVDFILLQHYADGVPRSWEFILQDQLPTIILTIGYMFAMIDLRKENYA